MLRALFTRLLAAIPTLLVIITVAFLLMRMAPGGPFDEEQALLPEVRRNLEAAYGLDRPLLEQYVSYVSGVLRGDFGPSFRYKDQSVTELIVDGLRVSAELGAWALLLSVLFGVSLGTLAALYRERWTDRFVMMFALVGIVVPAFVLAPLLALLFGVHLQWLPVAGWNDASAAHRVLPVLTLALPLIAYIARLMRGSVLEVLSAPFVRTARAKGLSTSSVLLRHVLPPALLPVISYLGPATAGVLTGSLVVEQVFALPGIGRYFVQGAINRDYTLVMGVVICYATLIVVLNIVVDLLYGLIDPRLRMHARQ
jgi:oligopeptide transport system permease protein